MTRSLLTRTAAAIVGVGAAVGLVSCSSGGDGQKATGRLSAAGASFPAAIYQRWFQDLTPQGINVNYQSVGSSACLLYTSPSPRDVEESRMPSSA